MHDSFWIGKDYPKLRFTLERHGFMLDCDGMQESFWRGGDPFSIEMGVHGLIFGRAESEFSQSTSTLCLRRAFFGWNR